VWALSTRTRTFTRTFDHGVAVMGVSRAWVALCVMLPHRRDGSAAINALPTKDSYSAIWRLAPNTVTERPGPCDRDLAMSPDGERSASSGLSWTDRGKDRARFMDLAPDWKPAEPPDSAASDLDYPHKPSYVPSPYEILSLRLGAGGSDVYVTYRGIDDGHGWRLERWTPEAGTGETSPWRQGLITRLASTDSGDGRLLAISPDGRLLVLADDGAAITVRRAPRYEPERFGGDALKVGATAAALFPDGERLVTGHADGRLVLWDVRRGRPLATAGL
jgi:WD40 repeat protein